MAMAAETVEAENRHRRLVLKAVRGAVLTTHSAAGAAAGHGPLRDVERALRAAEGILRSAAALLEQPCVAAQADEGPKEAKKKKAKRKRKHKAEPTAGASLEGAPSTLAALVADCPPGGSVVLGDLADLGVGRGALVVSPPGPAASSPLASSLGTPSLSPVAMEEDRASSASAARPAAGALVQVCRGKSRGKGGFVLRVGEARNGLVTFVDDSSGQEVLAKVQDVKVVS